METASNEPVAMEPLPDTESPRAWTPPCASCAARADCVLAAAPGLPVQRRTLRPGEALHLRGSGPARVHVVRIGLLQAGGGAAGRVLRPGEALGLELRAGGTAPHFASAVMPTELCTAAYADLSHAAAGSAGLRHRLWSAVTATLRGPRAGTGAPSGSALAEA